ncbi:TraR/DksA family transcriptional regulator [Fimbriiglobus ruber]|nr:TraR/DksA family transcriptional regulator [Fimbriiglobus ruber]
MTKALVSRRAELRKRMGMELDGLGLSAPAASGDSADAAFGNSGEEVASQLVELEGKELAQIERALTRIKQGLYGVCDGCACKIPVARLNALPYSTLCVKCQRESENDSGWLSSHQLAGWDKVRDSGEDRDIDLADLEIDLSK